MTNKDILEQYTAVLTECRILEKELYSLRDKGLEYVTDAVSGCPDYPPYGVRSIQIAGIAQDPKIKKQIEQIEMLLDKQYKGSVFWRNKAEDILSKVPNATDRLLLRYKCIDDLRWKDIAVRMGGKHTENSVKKRYSRIIKNI